MNKAAVYRALAIHVKPKLNSDVKNEKIVIRTLPFILYKDYNTTKNQIKVYI